MTTLLYDETTKRLYVCVNGRKVEMPLDSGEAEWLDGTIEAARMKPTPPQVAP